VTAYPLDMSALVDFLNARVDEVQRIAERAATMCGCHPPTPEWTFSEKDDDGTDGRIVIVGDPHPDVRQDLTRRWNRSYQGMYAAAHIALHDPKQVLADVKAKRSHIVRWQQIDDLLPGSSGHVRNCLLSVRRAYAMVLLDDATVYADHPDYRTAWKPITDEGDDDA
jgi:hypothetical protein